MQDYDVGYNEFHPTCLSITIFFFRNVKNNSHNADINKADTI